ncbi:MAG: hypothetical protein RLZZ303_2142 [Candidatus Hydrogenedentota bacterium]
MARSQLILPDQFTWPPPGGGARDTVHVLIESLPDWRRLPFHRQRVIFQLSAMRHYAAELRAAGLRVDYHAACEDPVAALRGHLAAWQPEAIEVMESAEHGVDALWASRIEEAGAGCRLQPNTMFLSDKASFQQEHRNRKSALMERFYRGMRQRTGLLMELDGPVGGQWNYDEDNREPVRPGQRFPEAPRFAPDAETRAVMALVAERFPKAFGRAEPFEWAVTRRDAEHALEDFLEHRLDGFGPYQDAMTPEHETLHHSLLSPYINVGLLDPLEVCRRAEARYRAGTARLNSVEGFIRQILGWREYVYQVYHWQMPGYHANNHLEAEHALPACYWNADTEMRCIAEAVRPVIARGINHHIQRLMLTGNLALLAGVNPVAVNDWYWLGYMDSWDWVVTPNVIGMALYADGGRMASKPYAASANYINRMGHYCQGCRYNPKKSTGPDACPFNALYWDFLARNEKRLRGNMRLAMPYRNLDRKRDTDLPELRKHAAGVIEALCGGGKV